MNKARTPSQQPFNVMPQRSKRKRAWWQENRRPGQQGKQRKEPDSGGS